MAVETTIGGSGSLFVGEDKILRFECALAENGTISATVAVDMAAWTMRFDVRKKDNSSDPAILALTPTVSGVFNVDRTANTQRAQVTLTDTQLNEFKAKNYRWSWKRMDDGNETVLGWGTFAPQKATAP
jgi:hypothetical protein